MVDGEPGKRGRKHQATRWVAMVGAETAGYFTLKVCLDLILDNRLRLDGVPIETAAREISRHILDELQFRKFKQEAPELFRYHERNFKTTSVRHKARVLSASLARSSVDVSDLQMTRGERIVVGAKLIDVLIRTTGLFRDVPLQVRKAGKVRNLRLLVPTDETRIWLENEDDADGLRSPVKRPMVVPPLDWLPERPGRAEGREAAERGGYLFSLCGRYQLVRGASRSTEAGLATQRMPIVYQALNRAQATPWRINARVLAVVEEIVREQPAAYLGALGIGKPDEPLRPVDIDTNKEAREKWRHAHEHFLAAERGVGRRRRRVWRLLELARTFAKAPAIYFPHNLDFRGRVYAIPSLLQPQGDDIAKGLLTFAKGKPLGTNGAAWLAVHGANCMDTDQRAKKKLSKLSLVERVSWVEENSERIERTAQDPFSDSWWTEADAPMQFLAFCFEWAGYAALRREGRGDEYVCSLPVAMDGTCNGIQHLSAMLLDAEGGRSVNLTPEERPQDFYQELADGVLERLNVAAPTNELAKLWATYREPLVNRKLAKGPGMTFSYGAGQYGFAQVLQEALEAREDWPAIEQHFTATKPDGSLGPVVGKACQYLAGEFYRVLQVQARSAASIMKWLSAVARSIAKTGKHPTWVVPHTGFKVTPVYWTKSTKQVQTKIAGRVYKPVSGEDTKTVDALKHANAIAANVVHSLDAAALMMTVKLAGDQGVDHFALIHDSYGTVPADCALLAQSARQVFFKLYCGKSFKVDEEAACATPRNDVIDDLERQFREQAGTSTKLPKPPARSDNLLDPGMVLASDYFMS